MERVRSLLLHLSPNSPIVGCEISPYIEVKFSDGTVTSDDIPKSSPSHGFYLQHKWYRIKSPKCAKHTFTLQCMYCEQVKAINKSYYCSQECFTNLWQQHKALHAYLSSSITEKKPEGDHIFRFVPNPADEVGQSRRYTPALEDLGHMLMLECTALDSTTGQPLIPTKTFWTSKVILPSPTPRHMIPLDITPFSGLTLDRTRTFTVLSYNVLADIYCTEDHYSFCPQWALTWNYRRQNLLREIVRYKADILCLQELYTASGFVSDGCATFFRGDHFSLVKTDTVEFGGSAAWDSLLKKVPGHLQQAAGVRLLKGNVALIVALQASNSNRGCGHEMNRDRVLYVANTHIYANPDLKDLKLWQVHLLLLALEKIANAVAGASILLCGDLNSTPGSAPHCLVVSNKVEEGHPDLECDQYSILQPISELRHGLCLKSAYSALRFSRVHRHHLDPITEEPLFTTCTRAFLGTLDYIFYSVNSLVVHSLLELLDEQVVRRDTALPSPTRSSDHIALMAQFSCRHPQGHGIT